MKVAFQGELGAFSQQAIRHLLGAKAEPVPCQRFEEVFAALRADKVDAAVLPIENTLHGSVHENYDLLLRYDFAITAETSVRIVHNLIAPPGVTFEKVRKVYSHPVAINQCLDFFRQHKRIERETFYDTAGSVKMIMEERPDNAAAIASGTGGENLWRQDFAPRNRGRPTELHAVLSSRNERGSKPRTLRGAGKNPWKTSLVFSTKNIPGALFRALSALALRDLNLVKIESRPLRGKPWEYLFYLDLLGRSSDPAVQKALGHLEEMADFLRVLGTYRAA